MDEPDKRIHLPEVLALAKYGRVTLWRRQRAGKMPLPIDRGACGGIYDRDAVLKALGMNDDAPTQQESAWTRNLDAVQQSQVRKVRRAEAPGERVDGRLLSGSGTVTPLWLARDQAAADDAQARTA